MKSQRMLNRLMYQPHPNKDTLFAGNPTNLVSATQNILSIQFDDLLEMSQIVRELRDCIIDWKPSVIPFFATGGIPYIMPVMEILRRDGDRKFTDGKHFHLYPGLVWGGSIGGKSSTEFFAASFSDVLRINQSSEPLRILVIDTTNSGNAVNKAVAACKLAVESSGLSPESILLRVIGIVNSTHEEAMRAASHKTIVTGVNRVAYITTPSGYIPSSSLIDRQFTQFSHLEFGPHLTLEVSYWLAGNIPTEDSAELIGVDAVHESLSTTSKPRAGRLQILYGNGGSQQGTGLNNLSGRLISLLSLSLDDWQWVKMRDINALPTITIEEPEKLAEIKKLSDGCLRLLELMSMDSDMAIDQLAKFPGLLSDVEVYWLGTQVPPPRRIARKVRASLEKQSCTEREALKYFRIGFPELASFDPGDAESATWWDRKIRSMPGDDFLDEQKLFDPMDTSVQQDESLSANKDLNIFDDLAFDFVTIAGGAEAALKSLIDVNAMGMSLDDIKLCLDENWSIAGGNALTFGGPTNEQAAMQFVLECNGWQEAIDCLESWITRNIPS